MEISRTETHNYKQQPNKVNSYTSLILRNIFRFHFIYLVQRLVSMKYGDTFGEEVLPQTKHWKAYSSYLQKTGPKLIGPRTEYENERICSSDAFWATHITI